MPNHHNLETFRVQLQWTNPSCPEENRAFWRNMQVEMHESCGCYGNVAEWVENAVEEFYGDTEHKPKVLQFRRLPSVEVRQTRTVTICLYETSRHYGGPEEGGWYYSVQRALRRIVVRAEYRNRASEIAAKWANAKNIGRHSGDDSFHYMFETNQHRLFETNRRPHYC